MTKPEDESPRTRLNYIVTRALGSSPYSREYHDRYYTAMKRYGYAIEYTEPHICAYIRQRHTEDKMRLVLNMNQPDAMVTHGVHHELAHIHQAYEFERSNVEFSAFRVPVTDFVAQNLLIEIHAINASHEGPLLGFVQDLQQGKFDKIYSYKSHVAILDQDFQDYALSFTGKDMIQPETTAQMVDFLGYHLLNEQQLNGRIDFTQARIGVAKKFLEKEGLQNNQNLEFYIGQALSTYESVEAVKQTDQDDVFDFINSLGLDDAVRDFLGGERKPHRKSATLERLSTLLNQNKDDVFLTLPQWQKVLQAQDNAEFIDRVMFHSPHRARYEKIVARNRADGLFFG